MYKLLPLPLAWQEIVPHVMASSDYTRVETFLAQQDAVIYPPAPCVFRALALTPPEKVKCVILGQDPYHGDNQAMGLSFSVPRTQKIPPSLRNIYQEIERSTGKTMPPHGDLTHWAEQGVLLLNSTLTVEKSKANSHKNIGWSAVTDAIIGAISAYSSGCVFMLWGGHAHSKASLVQQEKHCVLQSVHPSPLSAYRGFIGCNHFVEANAYLEQQGKTPIDWHGDEALHTLF